MEMNYGNERFFKYLKRVLWIAGYLPVLLIEIFALVIMGYLWAFMFAFMLIFINIEDVIKNGAQQYPDIYDIFDNVIERLPEPWCISVWIDKHYRNLLR